MTNGFLNNKQKRVILTVTSGNILAWYDIYSYAYFAPILARVFLNSSSTTDLMGAFVFFGLGFIAKLVGAVAFGRIGDLLGRKNAFIKSIIVMTIPTFLMGCLPTYAAGGILAPILLLFLRIMQSIPEAGESPGTFCFLYENEGLKHAKFITSFGGVGNQIGAILGLTTSFLLDQQMSDEFLFSWGWRISFWFGGLIGLMGFYLRKKLQETPLFIELKERKLDKNSFVNAINKHRRGIVLGTAFGVINGSTFYLIATYLPEYFEKILGLSSIENAEVSFSILILTTILLPFFGMLGDRLKVRSMMLYSSIAIILLLYPIYYYTNTENLTALLISCFLFIIPVTCITALIPWLLASIFPTRIRFTGVSLAFNLADGLAGGFTPAIALFLSKLTGDQGSFCLYILICSIISFISYFKIKEKPLMQ